MSGDMQSDATLIPERVGDRLRSARVKAGLDLADIAARTRVPLRHLNALETGDYKSLPSITYSVGFAKAYAKALGEDDQAIAQALRDELGHSTVLERSQPVSFDDEEAGPVPSRKLMWTALAILLLVAAGYALIRNSQQQVPEAVQASAEGDTDQGGEEGAPAGSATPAAPANPAGTVVLTARDPVWLRVYDAADKVLFEKEMAKGDSWQVPPDANNPMIRTGRADLLLVTIDGKEVPPLGPPEKTIKDVGISAKAIAARATPPAAPSPSASTPSASVAPATQAAQ